MKTQLSLLSLTAAITLVSCSPVTEDFEEDEELQASAEKLQGLQEYLEHEESLNRRELRAWAPGMPEPEASPPQADHGHALEVDWRPAADLDALSKQSQLIAHGTVIGRRFDALRTLARSKVADDPTPLDEDGNPEFSDIPVTVVTVRLGELARAGAGRGLDGSPLRTGSEVELMVLGGRMEDGCIVEPTDSPLPEVGEEAVYFLHSAGADVPLVGPKARIAPYTLAGGAQGRLRVKDGVVSQGALGLESLHGKRTTEVLSAVKGRQQD